MIKGLLIGSIWSVQDNFWRRDYRSGLFFAHNKLNPFGRHPALIKSKNLDGVTFKLAPGTSKKQEGSCVYRARISQDKNSYFILNKSIPVIEEDFDQFRSGWNGAMQLKDQQVAELEVQNNLCLGKFNIISVR